MPNPRPKLDESISSPQDLEAVIAQVREYARWFAHNSIKKRLKVRHIQPEPDMSPAARALIRWADAKQPLSSVSLDALLATLDDYKNTAPQLSITLAAPVSGNLRKLLITWCREHIAPNALVHFTFNSAILGGMVLRSGSHVFDWSFRRAILENREKFPEVLRNA